MLIRRQGCMSMCAWQSALPRRRDPKRNRCGDEALVGKGLDDIQEQLRCNDLDTRSGGNLNDELDPVALRRGVAVREGRHSRVSSATARRAQASSTRALPSAAAAMSAAVAALFKARGSPLA